MNNIDPIHIQFKNQQNPNVGFDLIQLENLHDRRITSHSPFQAHLVEFYILLFIESGEGFHTIDFTEYPCSAGTILSIRKDQIHKFDSHKSLKGKLILFTDDFLVSYLEELEALKSLQLFNEILGSPHLQLSKAQFATIQALIDRMGDEYFQPHDNHTTGIIRSELHILITKLFRIKSKKNPIIENRKYLNEFINFQQLVEQKATSLSKVKDYAKLMGLSTKTLNTITQTIVNKSAKAFIDDICVKQIKRLLINTTLSVKEIAYASGFEETTNFYKYFKRNVQQTPEQFRLQFEHNS